MPKSSSSLRSGRPGAGTLGPLRRKRSGVDEGHAQFGADEREVTSPIRGAVVDVRINVRANIRRPMAQASVAVAPASVHGVTVIAA